MNYRAAIEGLLFVNGDIGLTITELSSILEIERVNVLQILEEMKEEYTAENRGIKLEQFGDYYKFLTKEEHSEFYKKLYQKEATAPLTANALEVLAIIAYNEPITRSRVDEIRGSDSSYHIRRLVNKNLIEEKGKSNSPGRPYLYGTTPKFLDYLGLHSINELPELNPIEIVETLEEDLYSSRYTEKKKDV